MASITTGTIRGVQALEVAVEVDVGPGIPSFSIVGLPDTAVQEARERVRSAIRASGFELPNARIVVNLAPGPLKKHGTGFDLPIAIGILVATRQLDARLLDNVVCVGELSLDGSVRRVPGLLAHAVTASRNNRRLMTAPEAVPDIALPEGAILPLRHLSRLRSGLPDSIRGRHAHPEEVHESLPELADVVGQPQAVRALLIAAAGELNMLMIGPPGSGKTMLARRMPSILPELDHAQSLETALVHSVAGLEDGGATLGRRPFRAPHHAASIAGLIGGGTPPRPGEVSLAHNGVLFLDEMPEFGPAALQCLRQPMEDGQVTIVRVDGRLTYPARFTLVGAANPCPCGFLGDPARPCRCSSSTIERYQARIGGPLMDRIDLLVRVDRPEPAALISGDAGMTTLEGRLMIEGARERACARSARAIKLLAGSELLRSCRLSSGAMSFVESAARHHRLSGRGITRFLRVARTIADLDSSAPVKTEHLAEALTFREVGS